MSIKSFFLVDYTSYEKETLHRHINSTHKTNCDKGDKHIEKKSQTQHTESDHSVTYQCEQCDFKSSSTTNLKSHVDSEHKKGYVLKRRKCEQCDKKFNKKETFDRHMREVHNSATNFTQESASKSLSKENKEVTLQRRLRSNKNG